MTVPPNVHCYTAAIRALGRSRPPRWEEAESLFRVMESRGQKPSLITFGCMIVVYEQIGEVRHSIQHLADPATAGDSPFAS